MRQSGAWRSDMDDHDSAAAQWDAAYLQSPAHNLETAKSPEGLMQRPVDTPAMFNPNLLLSDFLQERWKGVAPILWGRQLKQERLSQLIYMSLMNADHLPDVELDQPDDRILSF